MVARSKRGAILVVLLALTIVLPGCMKWFTPPQEVEVVFSAPTDVGGHGEIVVSVLNVPDGGLASISIDSLIGFLSGMRSVTVTPLSGFRVLAEHVDETAGILKAAAVRPAGGLDSGAVLKLGYETAGTPDLDFDQIGAVVLGTDQNTRVLYRGLSEADYYTKEVEAQ
jgi:hypothetical protein